MAEDHEGEAVSEEPETEAGRALLDELAYVCEYESSDEVGARILAIEREAAEKALHSAAERVRALTSIKSVQNVTFGGHMIEQEAVLAILQAASE